MNIVEVIEKKEENVVDKLCDLCGSSFMKVSKTLYYGMDSLITLSKSNFLKLRNKKNNYDDWDKCVDISISLCENCCLDLLKNCKLVPNDILEIEAEEENKIEETYSEMDYLYNSYRD